MRQNVFDPCANLIKKSIAKKFSLTVHLLDIHFDTPPNKELGDISFSCFHLARLCKIAPIEIAQTLTQEMLSMCSRSTPIQKIQAMGPYINFTLKASYCASSFFALKQKQSRSKKQKKIVIEFVSPNTNKPLHLGHVRNAFLGESISRLHEALGTKVIRTNLINDRGIHICKSMIGYQHQTTHYKLPTTNYPLPTPKSVGMKGDHFVGECYVTFEKLAKENKDFMQKATVCLQKWEEGDRQTRSLWKKMNGWVIRGISQTYKRLGISFDKFYFESNIYLKGKELVEDGIKKGVFTHDVSGAIIAQLEQYNLPNKVVLRKDGTSLYVTQDMYLAQQKINDFHAQQSITVVASEQDLYFKQLFKILELLGFPWAQTCYHLSYGLVLLPEGRMKSREGTSVDADTLLDELELLSFTEIMKREKNLSQAQGKKRACVIAHAALSYYLLEVHPKSDMIFKAQESISFQGKTGPYLLYTYARFKNISRKNYETKKRVISKKYTWEQEKHLLLSLHQFWTQVEKSAESSDPSLFAQYLFSLAKVATEYYHTTPVLKAPSLEKQARLKLISYLTKQLELGLSLLTITPLEKM